MKKLIWSCLFFTLLVSPSAWTEEDQDILSSQNSVPNDEDPNFEFALGYGILSSDSLFNIDVTVNIPISNTYSTQLFLNSNYLVTGSSERSFAQSELASNWYARNQYGRLGVGAGYSEIEPRDTSKDKTRTLIGRLMSDAYFSSVTLTANYTTAESSLNNISTTRLGIGYYFSDDVRVSAFYERFQDDRGWLIESYFQPQKYERKGSIGMFVRGGEGYNYVGVAARYYFDQKISLKERERRYY